MTRTRLINFSNQLELTSMITTDDVRNLILNAMPESEVVVSDMTWTSDHFNILVISKDFAGKSLIEQHKMVFSAIEKQMDKNIHAVQLKTRTPVIPAGFRRESTRNKKGS